MPGGDHFRDNRADFKLLGCAQAAKLEVMKSATCSFPLLLLLSVSPLGADTLELSGGGFLAGQAKKSGDFAVIRIDEDVQIAVPASRVKRTVMSSELAEYRQRAAAAGADAEQHYQLAIWCGSHVPGNTDLYKRLHMERAIQIDPEHSKARAWLGYKKQSGKWVLSSELMRDRGMIWVTGRWELPEAIAISEDQSSADVGSKRWIREVKRLVKSVQGRNEKKATEAMLALQAIEDPSAAGAIADQLQNSRGKQSQSPELRRLWVQLLGRFHNRASVEALVLAGVSEEDATIREAALDRLVEFGASSAVATYLPMLKSNDNNLVNRAARALSWFPDSELALTYVDALVTEHKQIEAPGPSTQLGFGDQGSSGLTYGKKPTVIAVRKTNPAVLSLLRQIEPDVDYGFDEQAWQQHFAQQRGGFGGDLRRDP